VLVAGKGSHLRKLQVLVVVTVAEVSFVCKEVVTLLGVPIDPGLTMDKLAILWSVQ